MTKEPRRWWAIGAAGLAALALGVAPQAVAQEEDRVEAAQEQIENAAERAEEGVEQFRESPDANRPGERLRDARERGEEALDDARERVDEFRDEARDRTEEFRDEARDRRDEFRDETRDETGDFRGDAGQPGDVDRVQGPTIGVLLSPSPTTGVLVDAVRPGGPADRAGIQRGDYILSIAGNEVDSPDALTTALRDVGIGNQATVVVWRNEQRQRLTLKLDEQARPAEGEREARFGARAEDEAFANAPWLGLALETGEQGVRVNRVYPASPAARAGLIAGDAIVSINGEEAGSRSRIGEIVPQLEVGDPAEIVVLRDGNERTLRIVPARRGDFLTPETRTFGEESEEYQGDFNPNDSVPEHAMMLEQHRHLASQHQRIEQLLVEMRQELVELRKQVDQLQPGNPMPPRRDGARRPAPANDGEAEEPRIRLPREDRDDDLDDAVEDAADDLDDEVEEAAEDVEESVEDADLDE